MGCGCAVSLCDLVLTFDLAVVTFTSTILSGLYLRNHKFNFPFINSILIYIDPLPPQVFTCHISLKLMDD